MKMKTSTSRKLRYGGVSAVLTALIIAVIIIVNVIFSALSQKFLWYADLTPELLYSLSDTALDLIENGDEKFESLSPIEMVDKAREENPDTASEDLMIDIIFCDDPDTIEANTYQRYVHHTALELEEKFPDYFNVEHYNIIRNPSSVSKFKTNSLSQIYTTSVIVSFGTEYRVHNVQSFYTFNEGETETPWAYNGEKAFVASILAVTRAESPVACITTNHGEAFDDSQFLNTLIDAGYIVQNLDLAADEIPEKCRLIVVFDPKSDFTVADGVADIDEIEKLDKFLDGTNSMMVFMDPDTQRLENFEEYLEEWGISYDRYTDDAGVETSHRIMDSSQALTVDGYTFKADYVTAGTGAAFTTDMRSRPVPQSIIFKNAMSISYSDVYSPTHYAPEENSTDEDDVAYDYASYYANGTSRAIFDVFTTSAKAEAYAGGVLRESASDTNKLKLMTVSVENRTTQEDNYHTVNEASYVLACGSTDFASSALLQSNSYGNTNLLLTALRTIGKEPVPVGLEFKPFADLTIDTITTAESTQYTVVLTVVPVLVAAITGIVVIVRRKNR